MVIKLKSTKKVSYGSESINLLNIDASINLVFGEKSGLTLVYKKISQINNWLTIQIS